MHMPSIALSIHMHGSFNRAPEALPFAILAQALDDAGKQGRAHSYVVPGSNEQGKGPDMLAWRPEQQLGAFVPRYG